MALQPLRRRSCFVFHLAHGTIQTPWRHQNRLNLRNWVGLVDSGLRCAYRDSFSTDRTWRAQIGLFVQGGEAEASSLVPEYEDARPETCSVPLHLLRKGAG